MKQPWWKRNHEHNSEFSGLGELSDSERAAFSNVPQVGEKEIGFGFSANIQTANMIRDIANLRKGDPNIRALALQIIQDVPSHNYLEEARAIGEFVQRNMRYVRDTAGIEQLHDPLLILKKLMTDTAQGDCDDMVLFAAALMLSIGCTPFMRVVKYRAEFLSWNHIYLVVYEKPGPNTKRQRLVVDCIIKHKPIGYEVQHQSGEEFSF